MTSSPPTSSFASPLSPDVLAQFSALVGREHCLINDTEIRPYCEELRDKFHGRSPMVLKPANRDEVAAILKLANKLGVGIVPQGGNTGLVGAQIPDTSNGQLILSLERLRAIRSLDPDGNVAIVEAGVILERVQEAADAVDRLFPLALGAQGSCQIGGNLSTNAGGTGVLAYGNARDLVLGLEVVLADGRIWNGLRCLRKDNTGYDMKHLFMGAEGTLGVITAASLKLFPKPKDRQVAFVGVTDAHKALALFNLAREHAGFMLTGFELMPRMGMEFVLKHLPGARDPLANPHRWYCLLELSIGSDAVDGRGLVEMIFSHAFEAGLVEDAVLAESSQQVEDFWRLRHGMSEVQRAEGGSIKHDISVPVSTIPRFLDRALPACEAAIEGCRPVPFGHLGDGNLHFNISQPEGADKQVFLARWEEINALVHAIVCEMGGSISAEHGIGQLKRDLLPDVKDPVELAMMAQLKRSLDPNGILNPGKMLPELPLHNPKSNP